MTKEIDVDGMVFIDGDFARRRLTVRITRDRRGKTLSIADDNLNFADGSQGIMLLTAMEPIMEYLREAINDTGAKDC